jgi:hypothetical protein
MFGVVFAGFPFNHPTCSPGIIGYFLSTLRNRLYMQSSCSKAVCMWMIRIMIGTLPGPGDYRSTLVRKQLGVYNIRFVIYNRAEQMGDVESCQRYFFYDFLFRPFEVLSCSTMLWFMIGSWLSMNSLNPHVCTI